MAFTLTSTESWDVAMGSIIELLRGTDLDNLFSIPYILQSRLGEADANFTHVPFHTFFISYILHSRLGDAKFFS